MRLHATLCLLVLAATLTVGGAARAQDLEVYVGLSAEADRAFEVLGDDATATAREQAIEAADAVISWLRAFRLSDPYAAMADDDRAAVLMDLHRWEYNAARQEIELGRCDEARDRLGAVLDAGVVDQALLPRLGASYAEAVACATPSFGVIEISAEPEDAEVWIDGARSGTAGAAHRVLVGAHEIELRAPGYRTTRLSVDVTGDGDRVAVGPVSLAPLPVEVDVAADGGGRGARRALFAAGGGLVALGAGGLISAETYRGRASDPPSGYEVYDQDREDSIVRRRRVLGAASIGAGLAVTVVAAVLGDGREERAAGPVSLSVDGLRIEWGGARR